MMVRTALVVGVTTAALGAVAVGQIAAIEIRSAQREAPAVQAASAARPTLTAVGGKGLKVSDQPQILPVTGKDFADGLTATLVAPLGTITTYAPASLVELTPTSFKVSVWLDEPGTYFLTVRLREGEKSNTLPVVVRRSSPGVEPRQ